MAENRWVTGVIIPINGLMNGFHWDYFTRRNPSRPTPNAPSKKKGPSDDIRGQHHFSPIGHARVDLSWCLFNWKRAENQVCSFQKP